MFEAKPPSTADALPLEEQQIGEALHPLSWDDLVARLSAARNLRASLGGSGNVPHASFDAGSARRIAAHHNGKHAVNLDDSSNGKGTQGIAEPAVHGAASGVARE
jgi:hypothetical protein